MPPKGHQYTARMTDPALSGQVQASDGIPDWRTFARTHEWRRAQAAASLRRADPTITAAITALSSFQEDVRAKRYPAARRALSAYAAHLQDAKAAGAGQGALLLSLAAPESLETGLAALEQVQSYPEPAELEGALAPALAHPLTRAEALNAQGVLRALREEPDLARADFERALEADPQHYRARMNLGNLALESGDPKQAETQYREVLKLAPDYDGAHHNLGVALRRQGKLQASVGAIRRAQRLGARRMQQEAKDDVQEQLRVNPRLRLIRNIVLGVVGLIVLLVLLQSQGKL